MSLELADRSIQYPQRIAEDVLIKIDKSVLPIDFVILDMREDSRIPIILGRPFLAIARATIDVFNKKITLRVGSEEVIFYVDQSMKKPRTEDDKCYGIDDLDTVIQSAAQELLENDHQTQIQEEAQNEHLYSASAIEIDEKRPKLKDLPSHLEYAYLKGDESCRVIISSKLTEKEKISLLRRRLNPKVQDVVKDEIVRLLDSGLIYPISDSPWVSPIHVVPKKGGMIVVLNENNELIPSRIVTGWRVCIDYRKLNDATQKDHFPHPFIDQMLERLSGNEYYCLLNPNRTRRLNMTTFTCPYRTFAYRRMPFGLCNAPATFQRCMTAIFHDMVEDFMEVFMDDFSVFGNSFDQCLNNLDKMLGRCEETNLVLNWEKCHFMVKEGIVLGHKISGKGIEVDKAKIDVIAKLPYPTNVKGVRSFLGHAGFYRRFIKDFSMISKPMTQLLMKDAKFDFSEDCKKAFNKLKERLTTAPIIISPDWSMPFELMCDASDFAVGAVLGQRIDGKFKPIYYASKTLNDAQAHYTTTEKELLAVVFSFDKFRPYLILSKTVVYTDHSALKAENLAADHLSRLENPNIRELAEEEIEDKFPDEHLMILKTKLNDEESWYADYVNYIVGKVVPPEWTPEKKKQFFSQVQPGDIIVLQLQVKAQALPTNDARVVVKFLKGLFARFEDLAETMICLVGQEEVVLKVDDVSLVNGVFDGVFSGDEEEDIVIGEGMIVASSSLEMLTKSFLGGMMVRLIFFEGLEEEARVEAMEKRYEGDEDDRKYDEDKYLIWNEWIKEVKHKV
ncbi:putative nucleotidyltransferase, ribonuclease H [Tanacetum coccineum]